MTGWSDSAQVGGQGTGPTDVCIRNGGAGRGARLMRDAMRSINARSSRFRVSVLYTDPEPGKAAELAAETSGTGLIARSVEARIEELIAREGVTERTPVVTNLDRASAVSAALTATIGVARPVASYQLVRMPKGRLMGIALVAAANDDDVKREGSAFFAALGKVTARSGSDVVLGSRGRPEHLVIEPAFRAWFDAHVQANLAKLIAGTEPDSAPIVVTLDGRSTMPMLLRNSIGGWADPQTLAQDAVKTPLTPIVRGDDFAIGECGPDGLRIHVLRMRTSDGRLALHGAPVFDPDVARTLEAEDRARLQRNIEEAARRAERETISRMQPVFTTD